MSAIYYGLVHPVAAVAAAGNAAVVQAAWGAVALLLPKMTAVTDGSVVRTCMEVLNKSSAAEGRDPEFDVAQQALAKAAQTADETALAVFCRRDTDPPPTPPPAKKARVSAVKLSREPLSNAVQQPPLPPVLPPPPKHTLAHAPSQPAPPAPAPAPTPLPSPLAVAVGVAGSPSPSMSSCSGFPCGVPGQSWDSVHKQISALRKPAAGVLSAVDAAWLLHLLHRHYKDHTIGKAAVSVQVVKDAFIATAADGSQQRLVLANFVRGK